jgi:hypothetical protein
MGEKIFECEYKPGEEIVFRFRPPKMKGVPETTREHLKAARREMLLALRDFINEALERSEPAKPKGPTKIEVE